MTNEIANNRIISKVARVNANKGISLILLVITIIIMIILATVIILTLSGNGIISKANQAAASNDLSELQSAVNLKISEKKLAGETILSRYKLSELGIEDSKYEDI